MELNCCSFTKPSSYLLAAVYFYTGLSPLSVLKIKSPQRPGDNQSQIPPLGKKWLVWRSQFRSFAIPESLLDTENKKS